MFSAAEVGAPHQRKRVFILGWLPDACGRRLMDAVQRSQCEAGVETREPARGGCGELADTAGQRDRKSSEGIPVGNQRLPGRQEGSADVGGRVQEELADTDNCRGGKDQQPAQLWPEGVKQSPGDSAVSYTHLTLPTKA